MPDVHARLQAASRARVADVGCGYGWSSIGIARGYPNAQVDGSNARVRTHASTALRSACIFKYATRAILRLPVSTSL
jgi:trans-aconitate methyltransferase